MTEVIEIITLPINRTTRTYDDGRKEVIASLDDPSFVFDQDKVSLIVIFNGILLGSWK